MCRTAHSVTGHSEGGMVTFYMFRIVQRFTEGEAMKITFMGAGSTEFAKNVLGDCMLAESLRDAEIALYDIDGERLEESYQLITALNHNINEDRAAVHKYLGVEERKDALRGGALHGGRKRYSSDLHWRSAGTAGCNEPDEYQCAAIDD